MLFKLQKTRKFTYRPKYYQPPEEEDEEQPRIKFRRLKSYNPVKKKSVIAMVVIAIVLLYFLSYWLKIDSAGNKEFKFEEIKIEEIQ